MIFYSIGIILLASVNLPCFAVNAGTMAVSESPEQLPLYWGWFVQEDYSSTFLKRSQKILADSLQSVPEFLADVQGFTQLRYISDILAFYKRENPDEVLHCTAMYNGVYPDYTEGAVEYANKPEVKESVGKASVLHAIGWVLTPRTFGARIKLQPEQLAVWNSNDTEGNPPERKSRSIAAASSFIVYENTLKTENITDQDPDVVGNFRPTSGLGSRAHLTLGCAPGIGAVTTGYDLVDVIRLESNSPSETPTYNLSDDAGWLRNYGNGQWVFYPKKQWLLDSTFLGYSSSSHGLISSVTVIMISCLLHLLNISQ